MKGHQGSVIRIKAVERLQNGRPDDTKGLPKWTRFDTLLSFGTDWKAKVWSVRSTAKEDEITLALVAQVSVIGCCFDKFIL